MSFQGLNGELGLRLIAYFCEIAFLAVAFRAAIIPSNKSKQFAAFLAVAGIFLILVCVDHFDNSLGADGARSGLVSAFILAFRIRPIADGNFVNGAASAHLVTLFELSVAIALGSFASYLRGRTPTERKDAIPGSLPSYWQIGLAALGFLLLSLWSWDFLSRPTEAAPVFHYGFLEVGFAASLILIYAAKGRIQAAAKGWFVVTLTLCICHQFLRWSGLLRWDFPPLSMVPSTLLLNTVDSDAETDLFTNGHFQYDLAGAWEACSLVTLVWWGAIAAAAAAYLYERRPEDVAPPWNQRRIWVPAVQVTAAICLTLIWLALLAGTNETSFRLTVYGSECAIFALVVGAVLSRTEEMQRRCRGAIATVSVLSLLVSLNFGDHFREGPSSAFVMILEALTETQVEEWQFEGWRHAKCAVCSLMIPSAIVFCLASTARDRKPAAPFQGRALPRLYIADFAVLAVFVGMTLAAIDSESNLTAEFLAWFFESSCLVALFIAMVSQGKRRAALIAWIACCLSMFLFHQFTRNGEIYEAHNHLLSIYPFGIRFYDSGKPTFFKLSNLDALRFYDGAWETRSYLAIFWLALLVAWLSRIVPGDAQLDERGSPIVVE